MPVLIQRATDQAALAAVLASGGRSRRRLKTGRALAARCRPARLPGWPASRASLRVSYDAPVRLQGEADWDDRPLASGYPDGRRRAGAVGGRRGRSWAPG